MPVILWLIAVAAGAANPFQSGANAELGKRLAQPFWAGAVVYASGLAGLLLLQALFGHGWVPAEKLRAVPWWAWLGGLISIAPTMAGLMLAQKLGSTLFTGLSITAAIVTSALVDQFGLIGFRQHTASPARVIGCGLMVVGVWLVARF